MGTVEKTVAQPIAAMDRALDPFWIHTQMRTVPIGDIVGVFQEAESLGKQAWIAMAICCGVAQERAGRGDKILAKLARTFSYDKSRIVRLARAYREVIKPRLLAQGSNAQFPLAERGWYETSAENAVRLDRSPLDLLEEAESRVIDNPAYTQRRWRSDLGLMQTAGGIGAALKSLSELDDAAMRSFCEKSENRDLVQRVVQIIGKFGFPEGEIIGTQN